MKRQEPARTGVLREDSQVPGPCKGRFSCRDKFWGVIQGHVQLQTQVLGRYRELQGAAGTSSQLRLQVQLRGQGLERYRGWFSCVSKFWSAAGGRMQWQRFWGVQGSFFSCGDTFLGLAGAGSAAKRSSGTSLGQVHCASSFKSAARAVNLPQ